MTWPSYRSLCSPAQPSQCSTAAPEPCTTSSTTITTSSSTYSTKQHPPCPPACPWTPSAGQPAAALCHPLWLPHPPPALPPPACAGMSHPADCQHRVKPGPPGHPGAHSPSPARTWHATCARSSAMPTSIPTQGHSTLCRFSPLREGARRQVLLAPSAQLGWKVEVGLGALWRRRVSNRWRRH